MNRADMHRAHNEWSARNAPAAGAALSPGETEHLTSLESVIAAGLDTFLEVGEALAEIRDSRLYRQTHSTFEGYVRERWNISHGHAHRLIQAARITERLPIGDRPRKEAQARELVGLSPEQARTVMSKVAEQTGEPTARAIRVVREQVEQQPPAGDTGAGWHRPVGASASSKLSVLHNHLQTVINTVAGAVLSKDERVRLDDQVRLIRALLNELADVITQASEGGHRAG